MKRTKQRFQPKEDTTRVPRPLGLTLLNQQLLKERNNTQSLPEETIHKILQYVLSGNMVIGNKPVSLHQLAIYLNTPLTSITKALLSYNERMSKAVLGNGQNNAGALFFLLFQNFMASYQGIRNQRSILEAAQGTTFKPFLTNALNDILGEEMGSNKVLMDVLKTYMGMAGSGPGGSGFNGQFGTAYIQNNFGPNQAQTGLKAIGVNEAITLLEEQGLMNLSYNPDTFKGLKAAHKIESMPEVRANLQNGADDDMYKKDTKANHRNRRSKELDIDEEDLV